MEKRVYNFSPGPAVLPLCVLEEAQRDLLALPGTGISPGASRPVSPFRTMAARSRHRSPATAADPATSASNSTGAR